MLRKSKRSWHVFSPFLLELLRWCGQRTCRRNVRVNSKALVGPAKGNLILRQASLGAHQLFVLGTKAWSGNPLHFGQSAQILVENAPCPILIVRT